MTATLVRAPARDLVARSLWFTERVVVLGATGWLGSTMLALLATDPATVLPVASYARTHRVGERTWSVAGYDLEQIAGFAPTVVLDFAYLTRNREVELGADEYTRRLADLTARLDRVSRLPSVRAVLTVSSGAALTVPEGPSQPVGPYGEGKRAVEDLGTGLVDPARSVVVARTYSLSGTLVGRPHEYGFSDLVLQARTGRVEVRSPGEVWRRYSGADDYLAVCLAELMAGRSGVIESGGPLVELRDLAMQIADRYPGSRPEVVASPPTGEPLRYASDDVDWQAACGRQGYVPATLGQQIDAVQAALP